MNATNFSPFNFRCQGTTLLILVKKHVLNFNFSARTSRGALQHKPTYFVKIQELTTGKIGMGECSPLQGLSIEYDVNYEGHLKRICEELANKDDYQEFISINSIKDFPSIRFGLEMAIRDIQSGSKKLLFDNPFVNDGIGLPINGLVWMGNYDFMLSQMQEKLKAGFKCIKLKIGGIEFTKECELLARLRKDFSPQKITIRLDANGAFSPGNAMEKLDKLAEFEVHSIEQPIRQGQLKAMHFLCKNSPIPIALDEELIGVNQVSQKKNLLEKIDPPYIILKPSLLGGFKASKEWIELAVERGISWWITSALESNVGLNAIAQFTANYNIEIPQGLGTGQLYKNNIESPLKIAGGYLSLDKKNDWGNLSFEE